MKNKTELHEKQNSIILQYGTKNKTAVKDNESVFMYNYIQLGQNYNYKWRYSIILTHLKWYRMCHTVSFYRIGVRAETRAVYIVITCRGCPFQTWSSVCIFFLSASSSEVCVLCFAVYSFMVFSFTYAQMTWLWKITAFILYIDLAVMHLLSILYG